MPTGCWDPGGPSDPWVCPWRLQAEFRPGCPLLSVRDECQGQCRRWARTRSVPEGAPRKRGPHYPPQFHCPSCLLSQARTGSGGSGPLRPGAASRVLTPGPCRHSSPVPHPGTRAPPLPHLPASAPLHGAHRGQAACRGSTLSSACTLSPCCAPSLERWSQTSSPTCAPV